MPFNSSENTKRYTDLRSLSKINFTTFKKIIKKIPYEKKGILYSEMFFLYLLCKDIKPFRIIESGRARGQSTLLLSVLFPDTKIISIEHDNESEDVKVASERLASRKNVKLLFGDSTALIPNILKDGLKTVVLIDGPKEFRSVRLALRALEFKNVIKVFIHDLSHQTAERTFLKKYFPCILFSDNRIIAKTNHLLDDDLKINLAKEFKYRANEPYGYSLTCISNNISKNYSLLIFLSRVAQLRKAIQKKFKKMY